MSRILNYITLNPPTCVDLTANSKALRIGFNRANFTFLLKIKSNNTSTTVIFLICEYC